MTVHIEPMPEIAVEPRANPVPGRVLNALQSRLRKILAPIAVFAAVIAFWQFFTEGGYITRLILPSPTEIIGAFQEYGSEILLNAGYTAVEAVTGYAIGNILGIVLAVIFVHNELTRRTIYPLAMGAQAIPIVAVAPALILWFGNGMAPKIFIAIFLVFFPMLVNGIRGLRSADAEVSELLYTLSASKWQQLSMVRLPASIPFLFNALKLSACACFVAAIVGEWIAADHGVGYLIVLYGTQYNMAGVWAAVLIGTAVSMAMYTLTVIAERWATPWLASRRRPGQEKA